MTGQKLKELLFQKRGELSEFAKFAGIERQVLNSRFAATKVDTEILRKYAQWRKIDVSEFLTMATGPEPEDAAGIVNEAASTYQKTPPAANTGKIIDGLVSNQAQQNEAMLKLSTAAQLNALSIAHLLKVPAHEITKILA